MKSIRVERPGGIEVLQLEECETPICGADEVLVQIKAAGINYIDIYIREGLYKAPHFPYTPGKEGSGIVTAVGKNVTDIKVGDRVAFCNGSSGSYAEFAVVSANQTVVLPESISFEVAAAAMLQGLTAYYLSHLTFPLNQNHIALIHAGAGGVGLLLIQMAEMLDAKIITTVSNAEKAGLAKDAGADEVIVYTQESFYDRVMQITNNVGVNVVYDAVGVTTFMDSLKSLAVRGMLVSYGQASGPVPPLELSKLAEKSLYLTRPNLGSYTMTKESLNALASALFDLMTSQKLKITIGQTYSLAEVGKAHADLAGRKTIGKSIILLD